MLTLYTAKNLAAHTMLYCLLPSTFRKGQPIKVKVTSVQTWKTRPADVVIKIQDGFKSWNSIDESKIEYWTTDLAEALAARPALKDYQLQELDALLAAAQRKLQYPDSAIQAARQAGIEALYAEKRPNVAVIRALKAYQLQNA